MSDFLRNSVAVIATILFASTANAAGTSPQEAATELLAKTLAAETKCNSLSKTERDRLRSYVAEAEIALAEQSTVALTKSALKRGEAIGTKVACDTTTSKAIKAVFTTARAALDATDADDNKIATKDLPQELPDLYSDVIEPVVQKKPDAAKPVAPMKVASRAAREPVEFKAPTIVAKKLEVAKPPIVAARTKIQVSKIAKPKADDDIITTASLKPEPKVIKAKADKPKLDTYGKLAQAYFVELRCRNMSGAEVKTFHSRVVANYNSMVAAYGKKQVGSVQRLAKARAQSANCG
jgi:hypothetical protein